MDPGISVRGGGGGGGPRQSDKKSSDSVVCLCFAFFLVLGLVYRSQMVNFLLHLCLFSCNLVVCFQSSSAIKSFLAWFIQHLLQFVFAFFNHSIKIAHFLYAGVISFPFQTILTDDAFRHQCK